MKIAFYISNHGFGHIMRNLPVMEELQQRGHEVTVVTGERQAVVVENQNIAKIICDTDAGLVVKAGTLIVDCEATVDRVREHVSLWDEMPAVDADCYVVDIVPWALSAAKKKGIPCFLMSSFSWIEQYRGFVPEELLNRYIDSFHDADHVLYYELVNKPCRDLLGTGVDVGFVARHFTDAVEQIRQGHKRPIVYLSLGASNDGLKDEIDVSALPYDFITTSAIKLRGDNVEVLPVDIPNTQDYAKAADYCIAKAGWSTVSEMMIAGAKCAFLQRPDVPEDTMIIEELERRGAAVSVSTDELLDIEKVIDKIKTIKNAVPYKNNYRYVADLIEKVQC